MGFHFLHIFVLICFLTKGSEASQFPAERYWQSTLPNTPMPKVVHDLMQQPGDKSTLTKEQVDEGLGEFSGARRIDYNLAYPNEIVVQNNSLANSTTLFFVSDDLLPNKKMVLDFIKSTNGPKFLPLKRAQTIPFSSSKFPEILNRFSVKPASKQTQILKRTIQECEAPGIQGEDKYCATSLESLVDYVIARLGTEVKALCNWGEEEKKKQEYTILTGIKMMGDDQIVCHQMRYPYAVYYCHRIMDTKVYLVPLMGVDNGSKVKALVVCHTNTSAWNPKHLAFQVLNVKPGGPPICHFVDSDTIVWVPNLF